MRCRLWASVAVALGWCTAIKSGAHSQVKPTLKSKQAFSFTYMRDKSRNHSRRYRQTNCCCVHDEMRNSWRAADTGALLTRVTTAGHY